MILDRVEGQDAGSLSVPLHVASGPTLLEEGEHVLARRRQWLLPMGHCSRLWGYQQHSRHLRDQGCSKHRRNGRDLGHRIAMLRWRWDMLGYCKWFGHIW